MEEGELEKVVRKEESLITCDCNKCEIKGDYWKCYNGNEKYCTVYLNSLIKRENRKNE